MTPEVVIHRCLVIRDGYDCVYCRDQERCSNCDILRSTLPREIYFRLEQYLEIYRRLQMDHNPDPNGGYRVERWNTLWMLCPCHNLYKTKRIRQYGQEYLSQFPDIGPPEFEKALRARGKKQYSKWNNFPTNTTHAQD